MYRYMIVTIMMLSAKYIIKNYLRLEIVNNYCYVLMLSFSLPPGGQYCCASLHMSDFWLV